MTEDRTTVTETPADAAPAPAQRGPAGVKARRRRRRWPLLLVPVLFVAAIGALAARLSSGPIYTDLLAGRAEAALAEALGEGTRVRVGVVGFGVDDALAPVVLLRDLRIALRDGSAVSIDTIEAGVGWATLVGRDAAVSRLVADHVLVDLAAAGPAADLPDPFLALAYFEAELLHSGIGYAEAGGLTVYGHRGDGGRLPLLENATVTLASPPPVDEAAAAREPIDFQITGSGASGPWAARMRLSPAEDGRSSHIAVSADRIDIADLGRRMGDESPLLAGPVGVEVKAEMDRDGRLRAAEATLTAGRIAIDGDDPTTIMEEGRLDLIWRPETRRIEIRPSSVVLPDGRAMASGLVTPPTEAGGPWGFNIALATRGSEDGVAPQRGRAEIEGRYIPAEAELDIDRLVVDADGTVFNAALRLSHRAGPPVAGLSGVFRSMSVERLKQLWPAPIQPAARSWVRDHLLAGTITDAEVDLAAAIGDPAGGSGSATLAFRFHDVAFTPFGGSPVIRKAVGSGRLDGGRFTASLESGEVELGDGRVLAVPAATFDVPNVLLDPPDGSATIDLAGPAGSMLALWQRLPLSKGIELGVTPADVSGDGKASVAVSMPLIGNLQQEQITYDASVDLSDLASKRPVAGRRLDDGAIRITLKEAIARITGRADIDGVDAAIDMTQPLTGAAGASTVELRLGDEDRKKLGLDLSGLISGPIDIRLESAAAAGGTSRQLATVDLADAEVTIDPLGWRKARGVRGSARFTLTTTASGTRIDDFRFSARDARVEGSLALDRDGQPVSANFPVFRLAPGDRLSAQVSRRDDGAIGIRLSGARFDARNLIKAKIRRDDGGGVGPGGKARAVVEVEIGSVQGFGDVSLEGVNMDLELGGDRVDALSVTADSGAGAATSASLRPEGSIRRLAVEVGDMGALLRFLDTYGRAYGGRATINGTIDGNGGLSARLDGQRWQIVGEPALSRLANAVPDDAEEAGEVVDIRRLIVDFALANGQLTLADGIVRSRTAGLTLQGDVDFRREVLQLSGSYMPAGAFDNLLGRIPILGQTLFAGGRAGLVGVTFRMSGPILEPVLSINPLSVVAPGVLRKLFELG